MANVITISGGQSLVINTPVQANYIVGNNGTLEVTTGGVLTGEAGTFGVPGTVQVQRGGVLNVT
ncbi:MAG TPA: hypothetical protein VKB93_12895, partial [Thermoanaerobaculia bacterium]|nr:hypothetical protein [Thermoanaerobaculia bacterium]